MTSTDASHDLATLTQWVTERVAFYVEMSPQDIEPEVDLVKYGMDSIRALTLSANVEDEFGLEVDAAFAWDHRTVDQIARYLATALGTRH
jgi:acyl carrier protein